MSFFPLIFSLVTLVFAPAEATPWSIPALKHPMSLPDCAQDNDLCVATPDQAGTVVIVWRGEVIALNGPYFSEQPAANLLFGPVSVDLVRVDAGMVALGEPLWGRVKGLFIGHSHPDHLGDVPVVSRYLPDSTLIATNLTGALILQALPSLRDQVFSVDPKDATSQHRVGRPIQVSTQIRVWPVLSSHMPHAGPLMLFGGVLDEAQLRLPRTGWGWRLGEATYAWVVDLLDAQGQIVYRMYVNDSAPAHPGDGWLPRAMLDEHPVDMAFVCAASMKDILPLLQGLGPVGLVALTHWSDFFLNVHTDHLSPTPGAMTRSRLTNLLNQAEGRSPAVAVTPLNLSMLVGGNTERTLLTTPGEVLAF